LVLRKKGSNRKMSALDLVNAPRNSNKLAPYSGKASAAMTANMLHLVREMSLDSEDFSQRQSDYWIWVMQGYPPCHIETAFHRWMKKSKFMPKPAEVIEILEEILQAERQVAAEQKTSLYLSEVRETREQLATAGLPYGQAQVHSILKQAVARIKTFPPFPNPNRALTVKERLARELQRKKNPRTHLGDEPRSMEASA
jgi:hypothetical protein